MPIFLPARRYDLRPGVHGDADGECSSVPVLSVPGGGRRRARLYLPRMPGGGPVLFLAEARGPQPPVSSWGSGSGPAARHRLRCASACPALAEGGGSISPRVARGARTRRLPAEGSRADILARGNANGRTTFDRFRLMTALKPTRTGRGGGRSQTRETARGGLSMPPGGRSARIEATDMSPKTMDGRRAPSTGTATPALSW